MRKTVFFAIVAAAGCGGGPTGADASCIAGVFIDDLYYTPREELLPDHAVSEDFYLRTTAFDPECYDQGQDHALAQGESNFLPIGTALHTVEGFERSERLAYWDERARAWRSLVPIRP